MNISNPSERLWTSPVESDLATRALSGAREVAQRCKSREQLLAANDAALKQTTFPRTIYWEPSGIAQGDAGIALMCSYLDACFPEEGWDKAGHEYLTWATRGAEVGGARNTGSAAASRGLHFPQSRCRAMAAVTKNSFHRWITSLSSQVLEPSTSLAGRELEWRFQSST